jgi:hypothetical protein
MPVSMAFRAATASRTSAAERTVFSLFLLLKMVT